MVLQLLELLTDADIEDPVKKRRRIARRLDNLAQLCGRSVLRMFKGLESTNLWLRHEKLQIRKAFEVLKRSVLLGTIDLPELESLLCAVLKAVQRDKWDIL